MWVPLYMEKSANEKIINLLVKHIQGGSAFKKIEDMLDEIPFEKLGIIPEGLPYSFWQVFDHIRIAQKDILEFSVDPNYQALKWPEDYWPENPAPESEDHWSNTKAEFFKERAEFNSLLESHSEQLLEPFPHGDGQNLMREALLIIEHTPIIPGS